MQDTFHYVGFSSLHETPLSIAARLRVPADREGILPAVIILHGSAGPTGREAGYATALNRAGIATLEPDLWAARNLEGGAAGRPRTVAETLPDVFGALAYLAKHLRIDHARIGLMGFSFGGVATMLASTKAHSAGFAPEPRFAAFMPCYPVCWLYGRVPGHEFRDLTGAPIFLMTAALDQYDNDPGAGEKLADSLAPNDRACVATRAMAGCHHGFDMPGVDMVVNDPSSNRGAGGTAVMRYNAEATVEAHKLAVAFFSKALDAD